jgi:Uma2 family endonuclease
MNAMTAIQTQKRYYSPTEYLELEEVAAFRSEYHDGEIVPMTGGTAEHNQIAINLVTYLRSQLKGKDYRLYINDVRLWIPRYREYTYPDVMLIDGKPVFEGDNRTTVVNPSVIIEVLSNSTKNYDKGEKFDYYRAIPEFKEYILVEQYQPYVAQYKKTNEGWLLTEYESLDSVLTMYAIALQIPLSEIYDLVDFTR